MTRWAALVSSLPECSEERKKECREAIPGSHAAQFTVLSHGLVETVCILSAAFPRVVQEPVQGAEGSGQGELSSWRPVVGWL